MSLEDRLYALVDQARQQNGDSFLATPEQLISRLSSQAPDLHAEIRMLAYILANDVAARIASAADPSAEEARIAIEAATRERLSIGAFGPAIAVGRRVGPLSIGAATGGGWAGDSVPVGAPPHPAPAYTPPPAVPGYTPPQQPHAAPAGEATAGKPDVWKNKWVLGSAGVVILALGFQTMQGNKASAPQGQQTPPEQGAQPPGGQGGQPPPGGGTGAQTPPGFPPTSGPSAEPGAPVAGGAPVSPPPPGGGGGGPSAPTLGSPSGQLPALSVQRGQDGSLGIAFMLPIRTGVSSGVVLLPASGWEAGQTRVGFMRPGGSQLETMGGGTMRLTNTQSGPMRSVQPQWQQDNIGFGSICVAFIGQQGQQEVSLQGATLCVMDASCAQPAACGKVQ